MHVHLEILCNTRVRVSLKASSSKVSELSVLLPTRINVDSMFESDSSVLKQTKVLLLTKVLSLFQFHRVSWPNGDVTADSRSKQSKRSSKRSLHERNGDWMDWNSPVISSSDSDEPTILIFQMATRSIGRSPTIIAADSGYGVL